MGPVTRSSHKNQANTKNVLVDRTNIPRMSMMNKRKEKQCVYSHKAIEESLPEDVTVYDFIGTNSPPRKVVKKKKTQRKKKPLSKSDDEIVFPVKKVENIKYNTRQGNAISADSKNKPKTVNSVSALSEEGTIMPIGMKKENKENVMVKENKSTMKEINEQTRDQMKTVKPLDKIETNASSVFADGSMQDVAFIPVDLENKENYSDVSFRHSKSSFGFSPIQHVNKDFYVTRRPKKRKYCVEDFTVENCFGFDETDEEVKSPEYRSVLYAKCSTPNDKNDTTRPNMQMSSVFLPAQPVNKTCIVTNINKNSINKDRLCLDFTTDSLYMEISNPACTQNNECDDVTSTEMVQQVTSTKSQQVTTRKLQEVTSEEIPQVTSTVISNESPVLFGDNVVEQHFNKPPRRSYERKVQVRWDSQTEAEYVSEDEICSAERNKSSKKRKVKEDKGFAKWAANVSAEFEEVESFQLYVE